MGLSGFASKFYQDTRFLAISLNANTTFFLGKSGFKKMLKSGPCLVVISSEASWEFSPECVECKQQAGMNILLSGLYKYFSCDVSEQISLEIKLFAR